jgi:hypothetical protein
MLLGELICAVAVLASYSLPPERIEGPRRPPFPGSRREGVVNKLARFHAYGCARA